MISHSPNTHSDLCFLHDSVFQFTFPFASQPLCACAKPLCGIALSFCICSFGGFLPHIRQSKMCKMHAADTREQSAALAPFQRFQPSHPPVKIVDSAALRERFASHFGGSNAKSANQVNQIPSD